MLTPDEATATISRLIRSNVPSELATGLLVAFFVLEQARQLTEHARAQKAATLTASEDAEWLDRIHAEYATYSEAGGFPEDYLDLVLSDQQMVQIINLMIERVPALDQENASNAVVAVAGSGRLGAIPHLVRIVRMHAAEDTALARDAIHAMSRLAHDNGIRSRPNLSTYEKTILDQITDTLRYAAEHGAVGSCRAREQAEQELAALLK